MRCVPNLCLQEVRNHVASILLPNDSTNINGQFITTKLCWTLSDVSRSLTTFVFILFSTYRQIYKLKNRFVCRLYWLAYSFSIQMIPNSIPIIVTGIRNVNMVTNRVKKGLEKTNTTWRTLNINHKNGHVQNNCGVTADLHSGTGRIICFSTAASYWSAD
jgi:hypothetical protein